MPKIDWLQFTIKEYYSESESIKCQESAYRHLPNFLQDDILSYLSCNIPSIQVDIHPGINMYTRSFCFKNGIRVCYAPIKENMGYNVIISGSVLSECTFTDNDLVQWINEHGDSIKLTRLDIAWDTDIDFSFFVGKFDRGEYITRLRDNRKVVNQNNRGTLYFGRREGNLMVRIYDKRQEQLDSFKGSKKVKQSFKDSLPGTWTRFELQFRHSHAQQALMYYLAGKIGNVALGHFRFIESNDSLTNKSRDSVTDIVYLNLINSDGVITLSKIKSKDFNMEYFISNVMSQVKAVIDYDPFLYAQALELAVGSKTTKAKLKNDELNNIRELRRLSSKDDSEDKLGGVINA